MTYTISYDKKEKMYYVHDENYNQIPGTCAYKRIDAEVALARYLGISNQTYFKIRDRNKLK